jgi:hypothetical protein
MKKSKISFKEAFFYRIISSDLSDLTHVNYDIIAFFSPADIRSTRAPECWSFGPHGRNRNRRRQGFKVHAPSGSRSDAGG